MTAPPGPLRIPSSQRFVAAPTKISIHLSNVLYGLSLPFLDKSYAKVKTHWFFFWLLSKTTSWHWMHRIDFRRRNALNFFSLFAWTLRHRLYIYIWKAYRRGRQNLARRPDVGGASECISLATIRLRRLMACSRKRIVETFLIYLPIVFH